MTFRAYIVDDEPLVSDMIALTLEAVGFSSIYRATTISQCLEMLADLGDSVYVVLLDLRLPDGFGLTVMEYLANTHQNIVGIVVITAHPDVESVRQFFELGTDSVLPIHYETKPLTKNLLAEHVTRAARLVEAKRNRQAAMIQDRIWDLLRSLDARIDAQAQQLSRLPQMDERLTDIERRVPTFLRQLGMDLIRLAVIALAVLGLLYFGVGTFIANIIDHTR